MIIISSILITYSLYFLGNFFGKIKINNLEKPIFSLGFLIILLNFFYFNLNLSMQNIFFVVVFLIIASLLYTTINLKNYSSDLLLIILIIFLTVVLCQIIYSVYGIQHYIFRGNDQDSFVYLSLGQTFFEFNYNSLISLKSQVSPDFENKFYLLHVLPLMEYRPTVSLIISTLINVKYLDIFTIGYIFKIICSLMTLLAFMSLLKNYEKRFFIYYLISHIFVFSFFYFYNFEIDAFSMLLSFPFFILIIKYSLELMNLFKKKNIFFFKYIFIWACFFIIYPNGAAIAAPPIALMCIYLILKEKNKKVIITNIVYASIIFLIIVYPTYKSTILYLYQEIIVGLFHEPDYWGYYGAFILGKDNPVRDPLIVNEIKYLWQNKMALQVILKKIIEYNIDKNNTYFFLNIIPSIFGYYHFSLTSLSKISNYFFLIILIYLNIKIVKNIFSNSYYLFFYKNGLGLLLKFFFIYFIIFFILLVLNGNFWSAIKLFFTISPIIFILVFWDISKINIKPVLSLPIILLIFLPIYKYSIFNDGIGRLDSFPSVIHSKDKKLTNWYLDKNKLINCSQLFYNINERKKKIYISLVYENVYNINAKNKCLIKQINKDFVIEII